MTVSQMPLTIAELKTMTGDEIGRSDWMLVTQERIALFAEATDDRQFVHLDAERAERESPFGGIVAHGFLTVSLISAMAMQALPKVENAKAIVNFGLDKLRFMQPVRPGASVRGIFRLNGINRLGQDRVLLRAGVSVEIQGEKKPALTADAVWLVMMHPTLATVTRIADVDARAPILPVAAAPQLAALVS